MTANEHPLIALTIRNPNCQWCSRDRHLLKFWERVPGLQSWCILHNCFNNVVITSKLKFFQNFWSFPTCFGCFLPANATNKNSSNYTKFTIPFLCDIQRLETCDRRDWVSRLHLCQLWLSGCQIINNDECTLWQGLRIHIRLHVPRQRRRSRNARWKQGQHCLSSHLLIAKNRNKVICQLETTRDSQSKWKAASAISVSESTNKQLYQTNMQFGCNTQCACWLHKDLIPTTPDSFIVSLITQTAPIPRYLSLAHIVKLQRRSQSDF